MVENEFYDIEGLPVGTIVSLENGHKALIIHLATPENLGGEKRAIFLTETPTIMWKSNHNAPGCRVVNILGKFSGETNAM